MLASVVSVKKPLALTTTEEINQLWSALMTIEPDDYITPKCYVEIHDILYISEVITKTKSMTELAYLVELDHLMTELNHFSIAPFKYENVSCSTALTNVLSGTTWSMGVCDVSGTKTVESERRISVLAAINIIVETFGGELCWHSNGRLVDLKNQIGNNTEFQVRCDKNSDKIERKEDATQLCTRLYVYGQDDITIESVNPTGKAYIDSTHINEYQDPIVHTEYVNTSNVNDLYTYALSYMAAYEVPILYYTVKIADLFTIFPYLEEVVNIGDTVRVYDETLKLNVKCRVMKITRDWVNPTNTIIELSNSLKAIFKILAEMKQAIEDHSYSDNTPRYEDESIPGDALEEESIAESKLVTTLAGKYSPTFQFSIPGPQEAGDNIPPATPVPNPVTAKQIYAYVKSCNL